MATMKPFEYMRGQHFNALITRTIPFEYDLSIEELDEVAAGRATLKLTELGFNKKVVHFGASEYRDIREFVKQYTLPGKIFKENFMRMVGDVARMHACSLNMAHPIIEEMLEWKVNVYAKLGKHYQGKK
jgi:hypothetical protein